MQLPGEGMVPEPGLNWEHYQAALLPENTHVNGVVCMSMADKVLADFWVSIQCYILLFASKSFHYSSVHLFGIIAESL